MAGFRIEGNTSGNVAEVDVNNNLKVNLPTVTSQAGVAGMVTINHDGSSGAAKLVRAAEVSVNRRFRVGVDNLMFQDAFNYAAQNTAVWNVTATTWAQSYSGGFMNMTTTVATGSVVAKTYKYFPLYNGAGLSIEFDALINTTLQSGEVIELGIGQAAGTTAPTDGVFFRYNASSVFQGVVNYNGTETAITLSPTPAVSSTHSYLLRVEQEEVQFWVDNVLLGTISTPLTQSGPCLSTYQPVIARIYAAGATSLVQILKVGEVRVFLRDINTNRPWAQTMAGMGGMGSQGQSGNTMGTTALMVNGTGTALVATAGAATAPATVFLGQGGNVLLTVTTALNTDVFVMGAQVPAGTAAINGKSLVITGVKINGVVSTALTGGPWLAVYSLAYGATAGALNTAEAATTKAFRRIPLGIESYGAAAAVGVMGQGVQLTFNSPIVVNQGEWYGVVVKNVGTLVTAGAIFYTVTFDSHWE